MLTTTARVAGGGTAAAAAPHPGRLPCPCRPAPAAACAAGRLPMLAGGSTGLSASALQRALRRARPPARLPPCSAKGASDSDLEAEILGGQGFQGLASAVANKLASGLAQQEGGLNRIGRWLEEMGAKEAQETQPEEEGEKGKQQSPLRKAASIVGSVLGVPGADKGWAGGEESPAAAAAHYLGADTVNLTVDTLKGWLTSPKRKDDVKMVGALVFKMLQSLEKETGESFQGKDHQYRLLTTLATELFGGSVTARVVRALVDSFLKVTTGR
ncbi:hypothetical protein ABPG75_002977 [Micractinium tetrahymenae]